MNSWEQLAGMIIKFYAIAIIAYAVLMIFLVLSGNSFYNMVINMIAGLSGLIAIIIGIEVLKRKVNSANNTQQSNIYHPHGYGKENGSNLATHV